MLKCASLVYLSLMTTKQQQNWKAKQQYRGKMISLAFHIIMPDHGAPWSILPSSMPPINDKITARHERARITKRKQRRTPELFRLRKSA